MKEPLITWNKYESIEFYYNGFRETKLKMLYSDKQYELWQRVGWICITFSYITLCVKPLINMIMDETQGQQPHWEESSPKH